MSKELRSECPINLSLETFGDKWSLLVLRDMIYTGARNFRQFLASPEHISTAVLSDRLDSLVASGMLTRSADSSHRQKITYSLTERAIDLVPTLVHLSAWGVRYLPVAPEYAARTEVLVAGGPPLWETFMDELRETHLGPDARHRPAPPGPPVADMIEAAYQHSLEGSAAVGGGSVANEARPTHSATA